MKKNSREKILDTARSLFPRYGYNGISIRAIASGARLTTGAVYFHFRNKKDIYKAICLEAIDMLISKFQQGIKKKQTPNQKLISTFDSYLDFFHNNREYYNILMESKADYKNDQEDTEDILKKFKELITISEKPIQMGIKEGEFKNIDPLLLSVFLAAVTEGVLQYKKMGLLDYLKITDAEFRSFMAQIVGEGIQKP